MIIVSGGEKGGTGKTTIATNLSVIRSMQNREVHLIDTDRQGSASYWCMLRDDRGIKPQISSSQKFEKAVRTLALNSAEKYDDVFIDAGGRDSQELRAALIVADIAIMPLKPSQYDLWTMTRMNDLIGEIKEVNPKLLAYVCINQASSNLKVKETEFAKEFLISELTNIKIIDAVVCERIAFRKATIEGMSVLELAQQDIKATSEIKELYREIFDGK